MLGNAPSASGRRTLTEDISRYVTALLPLRLPPEEPQNSVCVCVYDPLRPNDDEHPSTGLCHIRQQQCNLCGDSAPLRAATTASGHWKTTQKYKVYTLCVFFHLIYTESTQKAFMK